MKPILLVTAFLSFATACGSVSTIGAPCTVNTECEYGQVCNSSGAGGFCTRGCTFDGSRGECPTGSTCTMSGSGIGTTVLLCLPLCAGGSGCRDGYECVAAGSTKITACKPKPQQ